MRQWKAAGPAPKDVDDELWRRFRAAQDTFFGARDATNAALDAEYAANAEVKETAPRRGRGAAAGHRPRRRQARASATSRTAGRPPARCPASRSRSSRAGCAPSSRPSAVLEDEQWRKSDPEKSARADDMVTQLEAAIAQVEADLAKARESGNEKKIKELEENLASRQSFLDMARRVSADYS